jgi:hypothetical protein
MVSTKVWAVGTLGLMCALSFAGCFSPDADPGSSGMGGSAGSGGSGGACDCDGLDCCDDACVNLSNDVLNCGSCANVCPGPNPFCDDGVCGAPPCDLDAAEAPVAGSGAGGGGSGFAAGAGGIGGSGGSGGGAADAGAPAGSGGVGGVAGVGGTGAIGGTGGSCNPSGDAQFGGAPAGSGGFGGDAADRAGAGGSAGIGGIGGTGGTCLPEPPPVELCCGPTVCGADQLCCWLPDSVAVDPQCVTPVNGTCPAS